MNTGEWMMRELFHGWKRKLGVVTLTLSVVLVLGWANSLRRSDLFTLPAGPLPMGVLISSHGRLGCTWADPRTVQIVPTWEVMQEAIDFSNCGFLFDIQPDKRYWQGLSPRMLLVTFGSVMLPSSQTSKLDVVEDDEQVVRADESAPFEIPERLTDDISVEDQDSQTLASEIPAGQTIVQQSNITNTAIVIPPAAFTGSTVTLTNSNVAQRFNFTASSELDRFGIWSIPYWSIVVPLTILTLWLLLSKNPSPKGVQMINPTNQPHDSSEQ